MVEEAEAVDKADVDEIDLGIGDTHESQIVSLIV